MCQCGCSSGPDFFMPGPKGITYAVEFYHGCPDCDTPPGVTLFRVPNARLGEFGVLDKRQLRDVPWLPVLDDSWREYSRPVFKLEAFKAAVSSAMEMAAAEDTQFDDIAADVTYDEVFREGLRKLVFPRLEAEKETTT